MDDVDTVGAQKEQYEINALQGPLPVAIGREGVEFTFAICKIEPVTSNYSTASAAVVVLPSE